VRTFARPSSVSPGSKRCFRRTAELDVDKHDLTRYSDVANRKLYAAPHRTAMAAANSRDIV